MKRNCRNVHEKSIQTRLKPQNKSGSDLKVFVPIKFDPTKKSLPIKFDPTTKLITGSVNQTKVTIPIRFDSELKVNDREDNCLNHSDRHNNKVSHDSLPKFSKNITFIANIMNRISKESIAKSCKNSYKNKKKLDHSEKQIVLKQNSINSFKEKKFSKAKKSKKKTITRSISLAKSLENKLLKKNSSETVKVDRVEVEEKKDDVKKGDLLADPDEALTRKLCKQNGWKIGELLGKGGFGAVYKCTKIDPPHEVAAMKRVNAPKKQEQDELAMKRKEFLYGEIECLLRFKHPNSIQLFDFFRHKDMLFISMEYAPNGSLHNYYIKNKPFSENLTCYWMQQIARTLYAFHSTLKIAHRDMKPANVLLDANFDTKLSDFGIAAKCWDNEKHHVILSETFIGTRSFLSPQMLRYQPYNPFKSDVWATGIILFQLLYNHFPFQRNTEVELTLSEMDDYPNHLLSMFTPDISSSASELCLAMLNPNEMERCTFRLLLKFPWMQKEISRATAFKK